MGHSSGEIAAAYCAGYVFREFVIAIVFYRGYFAAKLIGPSGGAKGVMLAVKLSNQAIQPYLDQVAARSQYRDVEVACVNSFQNVTLSGSKSQINALKDMFDKENVLCKRLMVDIAYHSKATDDIAIDYENSIKNINVGKSTSHQPLMYSSVTGDITSIHEVSRSEYWVRNLISTVQFSDAAIQAVLKATNFIGK